MQPAWVEGLESLVPNLPNGVPLTIPASDFTYSLYYE